MAVLHTTTSCTCNFTSCCHSQPPGFFQRLLPCTLDGPGLAGRIIPHAVRAAGLSPCPYTLRNPCPQLLQLFSGGDSAASSPPPGPFWLPTGLGPAIPPPILTLVAVLKAVGGATAAHTTGPIPPPAPPPPPPVTRPDPNAALPSAGAGFQPCFGSSHT